MSEREKIKDRYLRRDDANKHRRRNVIERFELLAVQERQRCLRDTIKSRFGGRDITALTALDVGCGHGQTLAQLLELGLSPENLVGIDLAPHRVATARRHLPAITRIVEGNATQVDLPLASFDIVQQSTVFTSILDDALQQTLANRMWDLVAPGGAVFWYDFVYNNPSNEDVRGVSRSRIRDLFPDGRMLSKRVTLAPPIGRRAVAFSPALYTVLNTIPLLRSHVFVVIEKG